MEEWPRQYYQGQDIYALERYLLLEYVKIDLYEKQLRLGILSLHAEPFYPETEKIACETRSTDTTENEYHTLEDNKTNENNNRKDTKKDLEQTIKQNEKRHKEHETIQKNNKWIQIGGGINKEIFENNQERKLMY